MAIMKIMKELVFRETNWGYEVICVSWGQRRSWRDVCREVSGGYEVIYIS